MQLLPANTEERPALDRAHWLDLAVVLSDRQRTAAECARALAVTIATIRRPLREMHEVGILNADDEGLGQGTHYWLRPELRDLVAERMTADQRTGALRVGQTVLLVEANGLLDLANAMAASDLTAAMVWAAELDAGTRFLLILSRDADMVHRARLRAAIEEAGGSCESVHVSRVLVPQAWRRLMEATRDAGV